MVVMTPQGHIKVPGNALGYAISGRNQYTLVTQVEQEAALCYLPGPTVLLEGARYEQNNIITIADVTLPEHKRSSFCLLNWVTHSYVRQDETWNFRLWKVTNEVSCVDKLGNKTLLFRDAVVLDHGTGDVCSDINQKFPSCSSPAQGSMQPPGVVGILILYGPVFEHLASVFTDTCASQSLNLAQDTPSTHTARIQAHDCHVAFTTTRVQAGLVLVKFGAETLDVAKDWLATVLREEGTLLNNFGEEVSFN
ncbi:uncharacterized protein ATNIH1004_007441 [Aspergillus tanneri]|uniref:Urease accessory protein UreD n=1 Tax=Aspergillus tanneri TaxID=1220188 RepID=A0A5M9MNI3_9EURO|nr:uncharacterized protein ATNIH1004_007441 [Aspergillus tanneri]KAA8646019.1 hypothetical protein ATNIH1004_007441 [Aspergillus tanneri]